MKPSKVTLSNRCGIAIMAGVGGIMPSLTKLGSIFVTNPSTPLPEIGLFFGLLIFFFIGAAMCVGFQEWRLREAFILGICGPALITNILAGVSEGVESREVRSTVESPKIQEITSLLFQSAYAQTETPRGRLSEGGGLIATKEFTFSKTYLVLNLEYAPKNIAVEARKLPLNMVFLSDDEEVLFTKEIIDDCGDSLCSTAVVVPTNASAVRFQLEDKVANVDLPEEPFAYAFFNLKIEAGRDDLLWALGFFRKLKIQTLTASEISIAPLDQETNTWPIGFLSHVEGGEGVLVSRDSSSYKLELWDPMYVNDTLETADGTTATLTLNDNTLIFLDSSSRMEIQSYTVDQGTGLLQLNSVRGRFKFGGKRDTIRSYLIQTKEGVMGVQG